MPGTKDHPTTWFTADRLTLAGLLAFTLLVRSGVLWAMRSNLEQDPDAYREIAENLLRHGEFARGKPSPDDGVSRPVPTAYRPPLYPVVLSNLPAADGHGVSLAKVAALHLVLGVVTVWLTWLTAKRLNPGVVGRAHPTVAGFLVACDPILLNQQTLVMTETLAAFLAVLSLWCLARFDASRSWFNAALAGGAIGLAVLCRPTILPWLGLVAVGMVFVRGRNSEFRIQNSERGWMADCGWRVANLVALSVAAAAVMSPWAIRNYQVFGKPIVTTTHGGYTLLLSNNDDFFEWLENNPTGLPWSSRDLDSFLNLTFEMAEITNVMGEPSRLTTETGRDEFCYKDAHGWIARSPYTFARACVYRIGQLWSPLPNKLTASESTGRQLLRYATCTWYCGVYVLAAVGIWRLRWNLLAPPWIWGLMMCFAFTVVHTFYWTNQRMRAPLIPFVAIVATAAVASKTESRRDRVTERPRAK